MDQVRLKNEKTNQVKYVLPLSRQYRWIAYFKCFSFSLQILFILSFTTHKYSYSHKSFKGLLKEASIRNG
uniref:Uncharacterized protein n=1 Tax=Glycine max TaxID=3847 RepID=A0A0R0LDQ8_SOYBN